MEKSKYVQTCTFNRRVIESKSLRKETSGGRFFLSLYNLLCCVRSPNERDAVNGFFHAGICTSVCET